MNRFSFKNYFETNTAPQSYFILSQLYSQNKREGQLEQEHLDCPWPELLYRKLLLTLVFVIGFIVLLMKAF